MVAAVTGSLTLAIALAAVALGVSGTTAPLLTHSGAAASFGLALIPTLGLGLATIVGLVTGTTVVASLVDDHLSGVLPRLRGGWGRAWTTLLRVLGLGAAGLLAFALSFPAWPALCAAAAGRVAWRLRNPLTRTSRTHGPRNGLWLAIPFAASLAIFTALPHMWASLIAGRTLRASVRDAVHLRLRTRFAVGGGLGALTLASWGLGSVGLSHVASAGASVGEFAAGTAVLGAVTAVLVALAGIGLGVLLHTSTDAAGAGTGARPVAPRRAFGRFWRPTRLTATGALLTATLVAPTAIGALGAAASAFDVTAAEFSPGNLVVNTLADTGTVAPEDCADAAAVCGIRSALAKAAARSALGDATTITFSVDGTIALADTLELAPATTLDADGHDIVLDAEHHFRAVHVTLGEQEGGLVTLRGLDVVGGRSDVGGAGLFSDATRVRLDQMTFTDNVSGENFDADAGVGNPDGGAVAVPYTSVSVTDSTFNDNHATAGVGGAIAAGNLTWTNSTSVGDTGLATRPEGGAIYAAYSGQVNHATVIGGGGVSGTESTTITVSNSAVSTPAGSGAFPCIRITAADDPDSPSVGNVDPTGTCFGKRASLAPLGALAENGGPTKTVALLPGSAAIGAADASACAPSDQRGNPRNAANCDAGAFQSSLADTPAVTVALSAATNPIDVGATADLTAKLTSEATIPAGVVEFLENGNVLGTANIDTYDQAHLSVPGLSQGPHRIHADFVPANGAPNQSSQTLKVTVLASSTVKVTSVVPADIGTRLHQWATITATVTSNDEPGVPAPTGTVTFTEGDPYAPGAKPVQVDVVDGVATWNLDILENANITALYNGDDYHAANGDQADVTTDDLPTQTTVTNLDANVSYGQKVTFTSHVIDGATDPAAGPVRGSVKLVVDGTVVDGANLVDGSAAFASTVSPGTHEAHLTYVPDNGWAASDSETFTLTVSPAVAAITLTTPEGTTWPGGLDVAYDATGTGPATLRLLEGDTVLDSVAVTLPADGTFHVGERVLHAGTHTLHAEVVASATTAAADSEPVQVQIAQAASDIIIYDAPLFIGVDSTIDVFANGGTTGGTLSLTHVGDDTVLATAEMVGQNGTLHYTPTTDAPLQVTLTHPAGSDYLPVTKTVGSTIVRAPAPTPTLTWSDPATRPQQLTVSYPMVSLGSSASSDFTDLFNFANLMPAPSGTVTLTDSTYGHVGQAQLVGGVAVITFNGPAGECYCNGRVKLAYSGDSSYLATTGGYVPDINVPAHVSSTVVSPLPEQIAHNGVVYLSARTTAPTSPWFPTGQMIFTVNGVDLPAVLVPAGDLARTTYQTTGSGMLRVVARFVSDSTAVADSTSAEVTTTVSALTPPTVQLSTWDSVQAAKPFTIRLYSRDYASVIDTSSAITITDDAGHQVGTGRWSVDTTGTHAEITATPQKGGSTTFRAHYTYGDNEAGASEPLTLTVAGTPATLTLSATNPAPVAGQPLLFTVSLDTTSTPDLHAGPLQLQLHANGDLVGDPVTLAAGQTSTVIRATATERGTVTWSVTTAGDGADIGSGSGWTQVTSTGTSVYLWTPITHIAHGRTYTPVVTITGTPGAPEPTGRLWLNLLDANGTMVTGCALILPDNSCNIPTSSLADGQYTVDVEYSGDRLYEPQHLSGRYAPTLTVYTYSSMLTADMTPDGFMRNWVVGEQVTLTWDAIDPLDPPNTAAGGTVTATFNGAVLCTAAAAEKACSFTVPEDKLPYDKQPASRVVNVTYLPATESLPSSYQLGVTRTRRCLPVTTEVESNFAAGRTASAPTLSGDTCTMPGEVLPGRTGFLEGTQVTVTPPAQVPTNFKATSWRVEANNVGSTTRVDEGYPLTFTLTGATKVVVAISWKPQCVTVTTGYENGWSFAYKYDHYDLTRAFNPGWTDLKTDSNCSSPNGMSIPEREDFRKGIGHYAVGTEVSFDPHSYQQWGTASVTNPQWTVTGIPGTTGPDATHPYAHLTATEDVFIYPKWRLDPSMCTPTRLFAGIGGKLTVVKSTLDDRLWYASPDGRCLTENRTPGYWLGTDLEVRATPDSTGFNQGHYVDKWLQPSDLDTEEQRVAALKDQPVADYPTDKYLYTSRGYHFTVPKRAWGVPADVANFGVSFAEVRCVQVRVSLTVLVNSYRTTPETPKMSFTPANCGYRITGGGFAPARPERGQPADTRAWADTYAGQLVRTYDFTGHYTLGTQFEVTADKTADVAKDGSTRTLQWSSATNSTMTGATKGEGTKISVRLDKNTWVAGQYSADNCRAPDVKVHPAGLGYDIDPDSFGSCPDGQTDPAVTTLLWAHYNPQARNLRPIWSMGHQRDDDYSEVIDQPGRVQTPTSTYVASEVFAFNDTMAKLHAAPHRVNLYYCAEMPVGLAISGYDGQPLSAEDERALYGNRQLVDSRKILANGGPCMAPLMGLAGTTSQVGLSAAGAAKYIYRGATLNGKGLKDGEVPALKVALDGTVDDHLVIKLTPRCFTLSLGSKLKTTTAPNCPGAPASERRYLPNTAVSLYFSGNQADTFNKIVGADATQEQLAVVIMNHDRSVSADYHSASGLELAVKVLTSVEQRVVSALVTAAMGVATGFLFVVQVASLAVVGIAEGLNALGIDGAAIDTMRNAADAVQAGIDVVNSLADCTQQWATGGGAPPLSPSNDLAASGVGVGVGLAGEALDQLDNERASGAFGALSTAYDLTNMFATGLDGYLAEPADSWANIVDIGSCIAQTGRDAGDAAVNVAR